VRIQNYNTSRANMQAAYSTSAQAQAAPARSSRTGQNQNDIYNIHGRRPYQAASSQTDMRLYEQMTSLIDTQPSRMAQQNPSRLTSSGRNSILGSNSGSMPAARDTSRLMSARNQLADTNIARASFVGNRNSVVGQYQQFMRESAQQYAKHTLQRYI